MSSEAHTWSKPLHVPHSKPNSSVSLGFFFLFFCRSVTLNRSHRPPAPTPPSYPATQEPLEKPTDSHLLFPTHILSSPSPSLSSSQRNQTTQWSIQIPFFSQSMISPLLFSLNSRQSSGCSKTATKHRGEIKRCCPAALL
jgi:hypothetical protein